ncbi:hypothetical protein VDGE_07919 [Verticillium dahliae]|uniref:Clr5 domain-containing protein n=2 Tax=Verticillium dahliae TaxID=27337 RepID=A0A444S648_VERDA|nr:hypothetical protein VDGE_07919 [Verticillium dahliae]
MEGFASTVPQSSMPALSWDDLRVTITELYLDQGLTLPRLMERMRLEYGLHASTKMYKSRFTQWGIRKNMTIPRVLDALQHEHALRPSSRPESQLDYQKKRRRYLQRLPKSRRELLAGRVLQPLNTTMAPYRDTIELASHVMPSPPADVLLPDYYMHLLQSYVRGSCEPGHWQRDEGDGLKNETIVPGWCSSVMSAAWVLQEGKNAEAHRFLHIFIAQSSRQLARQDPLLFPFLYTSVLYFARGHPEYSQWLIQALCCVSERLPWAISSHPLRRMLLLMRHLSPQDIVRHASRMLLAYINLIHKTLGAAFPIVQDMLSDAMDRLLCYDLVSPTEVVTMGQCMVLAAEAQGHTQCKDHANLKKALAAAYVKLGDLRSGRLMATEVLAMHDGDLDHKEMLPAVHMLISRIDEAEGLVELARESALRAILASIETFGRWSDWTVNSLIHYRRILERAGRIDDARKVEDDRDLAIRQLQQKLENFNISDEPT